MNEDQKRNAQEHRLEQFIERLSVTEWKDHKGNDISPDIRAGAMMEADQIGDPRVIDKLVETARLRLMETQQPNKDTQAQEEELARIAIRALWRITRQAAAPGAEEPRRKFVREELAKALERGKELQPLLRREVFWMLSEIGDASSVPAMAAALQDSEVCEDARGALERIPDDEAVVKALREAFESAPEEFRYALAESLRARGLEVDGYPSIKMKPARETSVKSL